MIFLHAAHVHPLDPDPVEPIEGQRLRTRCASCHGSYDADWKERQAEVDHQITLHGIPLSRFIMQRFSIVVSFRVLTVDRQWLQRLTVPGQLSAWIEPRRASSHPFFFSRKEERRCIRNGEEEHIVSTKGSEESSMMTSSQEPQRNPERDFGPAAKYSDHPIGDIITYYLGSEVRTGEIIYITAPTQEGSMHHPLTYVVENGEGLPDRIWQTDILEETGEPRLVTCPYCRGMHMSDQVEHCPLKRRDV